MFFYDYKLYPYNPTDALWHHCCGNLYFQKNLKTNILLFIESLKENKIKIKNLNFQKF